MKSLSPNTKIYPIHNNVSIKLLKERKIITILVERTPHLFYSDGPTLYFDLYNPLTLPKVYNESLITQELTQQLTLKSIGTSGVLCSKDIFEYLATHASNKYFVIEFCKKHSISIENMMIVVHSLHINPDFVTPMMSLSYCFRHSFGNLIKSIIMSSWLKLTNGAWTQISVDDWQLKCIKRVFLRFENSTQKNFNSEIPFPLVDRFLQEYFHHTLIHPLYPNTELDSVKSAVKRFLSSDAENKGKKFHTFLSVESVRHGREIVSTSTELQSQSHEECANCKKAQPNLKKCGACRKVQYCGKECQRAHWKEHKSNCKESSIAPTITPISILCAQCKKQCLYIPCSCLSVFYCSAECHRLDWPLHKDKCTSTETLDSQEQETLHSQEQETLDSEKEKETATNSALLSVPTGKTQDEKQICSSCKKTSTTLHRYSCHKVSYCTVECQRLDWIKHKDVCKSTSPTV